MKCRINILAQVNRAFALLHQIPHLRVQQPQNPLNGAGVHDDLPATLQSGFPTRRHRGKATQVGDLFGHALQVFLQRAGFLAR